MQSIIFLNVIIFHSNAFKIIIYLLWKVSICNGDLYLYFFEKILNLDLFDKYLSSLLSTFSSILNQAIFNIAKKENIN